MEIIINGVVYVPKSQILFITEDGVEYVDLDKPVWIVNATWLLFEKTARFFVDGIDNSLADVYFKRFSTKEAAEQYILFNQKSLSLNDLLSVWGGDGINSPLFNNFKELAKTKQI